MSEPEMTAESPTPLTPSEWSKIIEAVYGDRDDVPNSPDEAVDALGPAVGSILLARETALRETIAQEIDTYRESIDGRAVATRRDAYVHAARIVRGQA